MVLSVGLCVCVCVFVGVFVFGSVTTEFLPLSDWGNWSILWDQIAQRMLQSQSAFSLLI